MPINSLRRERGLAGFVWRYVWGPINLVTAFVPLLSFNFLQFPSLALLPFSRDAFRSYNRAMAWVVWGWWAWGSRRLVGMRVVYAGDDVPKRENAIVVANHQGMADILIVLCLAFDKGAVSQANWMVKDALKWVPGLGWGLLFLDAIFLKRNWADDVANIRRTFRRVMREKAPIWLVLFPEGTRITPQKHQANTAFAASQGLRGTEHVLLPRTKGFTASMTGLDGHVTAVYSLTIGYPRRIPNLTELMRGDWDEVHMHVRRIPVDELPEDEQGRAQWIKDEFYRKDALLKEFHATGRFPDQLSP